MIAIVLETKIAAPIERCFQLSRSIDLHVQGASSTSERAIAGTTSGLIGLDETVTWEGRHFGLLLRHTSRITALRFPEYFQDAMIAGHFRTFVHDHYFEAADGGTLMRDEMRFSAPCGLLGRVVEKALLERHLTRFLLQRNEFLRRIAESEQWKLYLGEPA